MYLEWSLPPFSFSFSFLRSKRNTTGVSGLTESSHKSMHLIGGFKKCKPANPMSESELYLGCFLSLVICLGIRSLQVGSVLQPFTVVLERRAGSGCHCRSHQGVVVFKRVSLLVSLFSVWRGTSDWDPARGRISSSYSQRRWGRLYQAWLIRPQKGSLAD